MDVVGLGTAACNIVESFERYPQYNIYKIDSEIHEGNFFQVPVCNSPEEYEESVPDMTEFFSDLGEEVLFFVCGSGMISASSLAVIQQIKDKKITVYYIQPKINNLTGNKKLLEKATFGILQQYARSGLIYEVVIISNQIIADIVGNLPVIGYFKKINEMISSTVHYINIFERTKYVYGVTESRENVCRISSIGILDVSKSEENMFYTLDIVREKDYFYAINEQKLLSESNIISQIESDMQAKKENELTKISYRLYSTSHEEDFGFCVHRTVKVQGE